MTDKCNVCGSTGACDPTVEHPSIEATDGSDQWYEDEIEERRQAEIRNNMREEHERDLK